MFFYTFLKTFLINMHKNIKTAKKRKKHVFKLL